MSESFKKSLRQLKTGREILLALKVYGPLSTRSLSYIISNSTRGKLKEATKRLYKLGLIQKLSFEQDTGTSIYYYIDSRLDKRLLVSKLLKCNIEALKLECIRHIELPHEQRCARVHFDLNKRFPDAKIYRDYQLDGYKVSQKVFPSTAVERRVYPDILLHYVDPDRMYGECFIAFEVEESLKSKKRILDKLSRYATESLLDGVVYISTVSQIAESVRNIFSQRVLQKNLRIKHYGENFLLFQTQNKATNGLSDVTLNLDGRPIDLDMWITRLMKTKNTERRNPHFLVDVPKQIAETEMIKNL